jgi:pyrroline-5-carboxylate reductase
VLGLIGSGNMAAAIARGLGGPVLASSARPGRAEALVAELGGEALPNAEVAERADLVLLCHKPHQLEEVARDVAGRARAVVSVLGSTPLSALRAAYPGTPVARVMPNTPVEVRAGVVCVAEESDLADRAAELFAPIATVVALPERLIDVASGVMGVTPAYYALVAEAQVDAAVRRGLDPERAGQLVAAAMAGAAALLDARGGDTLAVRRGVTSPGGSTARGLAELERHGVRAAFADAMDAVMA